MKFAEELARFIRWVMRDTRFHALYACTVERQDGYGPLELTPDDEDIRGLGIGPVPIRLGLPGVEVQVRAGARVLLGFEAGDPRRPYAALWESASIIDVRFAEGARPLARVGDAATVFWPPVVDVSLNAAGLTFKGPVALQGPSGALIESGSPRVKA